MLTYYAGAAQDEYRRPMLEQVGRDWITVPNGKSIDLDMLERAFSSLLLSAFIDRTRITLSLAWVRREIR